MGDGWSDTVAPYAVGMQEFCSKIKKKRGKCDDPTGGGLPEAGSRAVSGGLSGDYAG